MGFETQSQLPFGLCGQGIAISTLLEPLNLGSRVATFLITSKAARGKEAAVISKFTSLAWEPSCWFQSPQEVVRVKGIPKPVWKAKAPADKVLQAPDIIFLSWKFPLNYHFVSAIHLE